VDAIATGVAVLTGTPALPAAAVGLLIGMIGGALPGISPSITMSLVLPFTFAMSPLTGIVLLCSTYIGAEYGGSIPAILIRTPGTAAAAATAVDGYEMNLRGRGGEALGISLVAGTIGGGVGLLCLVLLAEPLADLALLFTPMAYFGLGLLGLSIVGGFAAGSPTKGLISAVLGLILATIGTDPVSGVMRFTFGQADLASGLKPIVAMIALFAMTELMVQAGGSDWRKSSLRMRVRLPRPSLIWRCRRSLSIGTGLGIFEGLTPGGAGAIASFLAYNEAKRWSKTPEEFGKGSPEAVAAPEASNNAGASAALIPTLSIGIPGSNSTAVLLGGLLFHGLTPGPLLFQNDAEFVYGLFASLVAANFLQIPIGMLFLVPCVWLVNQPKHWQMACILALVLSGVYSINSSVFEIWLLIGLAAAGYLLRWAGVPVLPLILGLVLGYMIEANYRRSLLLSDGDHLVFLQDPLSASFIAAAALIVLASVVSGRRG